ncbi:MAG: hypothetical protein ACLT8I_16605 [Blautia faecis]
MEKNAVQKTLFEGDEKRCIRVYHSVSKMLMNGESFENALREWMTLLMSHQE